MLDHGHECRIVPGIDMENKAAITGYRQPINYENGILLPKIRDLSLWRDTDLKSYESGVVTLALLLPSELRKKALDFFHNDTIKCDLTDDGKKDFDDILVYILQLLEGNGLVFPRSTFEVGHD